MMHHVAKSSGQPDSRTFPVLSDPKMNSTTVPPVLNTTPDSRRAGQHMWPISRCMRLATSRTAARARPAAHNFMAATTDRRPWLSRPACRRSPAALAGGGPRAPPVAH